jgi:hypothetical protein
MCRDKETGEVGISVLLRADLESKTLKYWGCKLFQRPECVVDAVPLTGSVGLHTFDRFQFRDTPLKSPDKTNDCLPTGSNECLRDWRGEKDRSG